MLKRVGTSILFLPLMHGEVRRESEFVTVPKTTGNRGIVSSLAVHVPEDWRLWNPLDIKKPTMIPFMLRGAD